MLKQDSEMTMEEILEKLPPGMLQERAEDSGNSGDSADEDGSDSGEGR
jgi:hypothetical protein